MANENTVLGEVTLGDFKSAVTDAVKSGMASSGTASDTSNITTDSLVDETMTEEERQTQRKKDIAANENQFAAILKSAGISTDKFFKQTGKTLSEFAAEMYDYQVKRAEANKKELEYIYNARKEIGGISIIPDEEGQIAEGVTRKVIEQAEEMFKRGTDAYDSTVKFQGAIANFKVSDLFKNAEEMMGEYTGMMGRFVTDMPRFAEQMSNDMAETLLGFKKSLALSEQDMSAILKRQYAFTGEANADVLGQIANVSKELADATGTGANKIKEEILTIITDVNRFGNIGVDSAGRISAALSQLGVDFNSFIRLTDQFMKICQTLGRERWLTN
jgi:hypothetical protein